MNINDFWGWIEDEDFYHVKKNIHLIDDINEMGYSGQTLLSLALECRQINIAKFLIDHGADINSHGGNIWPLQHIMLLNLIPGIMNVTFCNNTLNIE